MYFLGSVLDFLFTPVPCIIYTPQKRYYSYKYAEVMSADAFAAFEEAGLDDEEAVSRVGRRFKDTVLSMGGGRHPSKVFRDFRGRDPTPEALLKHTGLAEAAPRELAGASK